MRFRDVPAHDRPRERAARDGVRVLADRELLATLLGVGGRGGDAFELADRLLAHGLNDLSRATVAELSRLPGVGPAQATRLAAAFELGRRLESGDAGPAPILDDSDAIVRAVRPRLRRERGEVVLAVLLSARLGLLRVVEVARGGATGATFEPADVLGPALREGAPRVALVHNHPGGDPTPSAADARATARLSAAARAVGVDLVDHVIVGARTHYSFADAGELDRAAAERPARRPRRSDPARRDVTRRR